jgi:fucose permease
MNKGYQKTIYACFVSFIVQAINNNFAPLLFLTFQDSYDISLSSISALITINFCVQLTVDLLAVRFVDKIGYRSAMLIAHSAAALGLAGLAFLPEVLPPFLGLTLSVSIYAIGGGIIEVVSSPIVEACPTENKEGAMSLLHSFYCWGHVAVVLVSTAFFAIFGMEIWQILACLWALVPAVNTVVFLKTPIATLNSPDDPGMSIGELLKTRLFWFMAIMMICGGASEQSVSQWASAFAEAGLGVSKAVGDLTGPLTFAILMGLSRLLYGKYGEKIPMEKFMLGSTALCLFAYLLTVFAPHPALSLVGCALCGFAVGIMWPGTLSQAAGAMRRGGTAMFALLALAGDIGCSAGPALVGFVSDAPGGSLKAGIFAAAIFPAVLLVCLLLRKKKR